MNKFVGIGVLVKDVEVRLTKSNFKIANFTLSITRDMKNKDGEYETDYISCVAYGNTAELVSKYLEKGSKISIEGHIQTGSYENKEGKKVYTTDVAVEKVQFLDSKKEK